MPQNENMEKHKKKVPKEIGNNITLGQEAGPDPEDGKPDEYTLCRLNKTTLTSTRALPVGSVQKHCRHSICPALLSQIRGFDVAQVTKALQNSDQFFKIYEASNTNIFTCFEACRVLVLICQR